jgi:hypothetical protein
MHPYKKWSPGMKGYKKCEFCGKEGHIEQECFKKQREQGESGQKRDSLGKHTISDPDNASCGQRYNSAFYTTYRWSMSRMNVDKHQWMLDSASNTNLTPFREQLKKYNAFETPQKVNGLGGVETEALGVGYVSLKDKKGVEVELQRVLYVPEAEFPILSLMSLRPVTSFERVDTG